MTKDRAKELIDQGFKIQVSVRPNKKYDAVKLSCLLRSDNTDVVYPVYYNHVKSWLNDDQLRFIELYNTVKNYTFRDDVEINIKHKQLKETKEDIEVRIMRGAIKKLEYIEQL